MYGGGLTDHVCAIHGMDRKFLGRNDRSRKRLKHEAHHILAGFVVFNHSHYEYHPSQGQKLEFPDDKEKKNKHQINF